MSALSSAEILALHRDLVATRSISGEEQVLADLVEHWMRERGWSPTRVENSVVAVRGDGPLLLLNSHLDTVPPNKAWTHDPWTPTIVDGRVIGLGANDAKASVAAMLAAMAATADEDLPISVALTLVEGEETNSRGTENVLRWMKNEELRPAAAVVGEPTTLDVANSQKGLCILDVVARGDACHAANAGALGATNAVRELARAITALEQVDLGPPHKELGPTTLEPTRLSGSKAKNALPFEARATLDIRSVPGFTHAQIVEHVRAAVRPAEVDVMSARLEPRSTPVDAMIVRAALEVRPDSRCYASSTLSDMVFMREWPSIKVGPGDSARSHTADEWVLESEILEGAEFYANLIRAFASRVS